VLFINTANALPLIQAGRVRGLAVSTLRRSQLAPEFPTLAESGLRGFDINSWAGFCGPARTPEAIVNKLNAEITKALESSDVKTRLLQQGFEVAPMSPAEFHAYYAAEVEKYKRVIRDAKIEMQ
jgi:tripartite-type tricarboxylate transporter receptor subunit TctC